MLLEDKSSIKLSGFVAYATKVVSMSRKLPQDKDLRVKRTERLIFEALIECTTRKGFSAVSVSDITLAAGINRATFYRHYKDKFDLLNQYAQTVYDLLDAQNAHVGTQDSHTLPENLLKIFNHVQENAPFYRLMWGKRGDPAFAEKIRTYIQKRIRHSLPRNISLTDEQVDLFVHYCAHASFGIVVWWLEHDMPYSCEEMIRILQTLESGSLAALLK